jgi:hypothetical protein
MTTVVADSEAEARDILRDVAHGAVEHMDSTVHQDGAGIKDADTVPAALTRREDGLGAVAVEDRCGHGGSFVEK